MSRRLDFIFSSYGQEIEVEADIALDRIYKSESKLSATQTSTNVGDSLPDERMR